MCACVSSVDTGRVLSACYSAVRYGEGDRAHATLLSDTLSFNRSRRNCHFGEGSKAKKNLNLCACLKGVGVVRGNELKL